MSDRLTFLSPWARDRPFPSTAPRPKHRNVQDSGSMSTMSHSRQGLSDRENENEEEEEAENHKPIRLELTESVGYFQMTFRVLPDRSAQSGTSGFRLS